MAVCVFVCSLLTCVFRALSDCSLTPNSVACLGQFLRGRGQEAHCPLHLHVVVVLQGGGESDQGVKNAIRLLRIDVAALERDRLPAGHLHTLGLNDAGAVVGRIAGSIERGREGGTGLGVVLQGGDDVVGRGLRRDLEGQRPAAGSYAAVSFPAVMAALVWKTTCTLPAAFRRSTACKSSSLLAQSDDRLPRAARGLSRSRKSGPWGPIPGRRPPVLCGLAVTTIGPLRRSAAINSMPFPLVASCALIVAPAAWAAVLMTLDHIADGRIAGNAHVTGITCPASH